MLKYIFMLMITLISATDAYSMFPVPAPKSYKKRNIDTTPPSTKQTKTKRAKYSEKSVDAALAKRAQKIAECDQVSLVETTIEPKKTKKEPDYVFLTELDGAKFNIQWPTGTTAKKTYPQAHLQNYQRHLLAENLFAATEVLASLHSHPHLLQFLSVMEKPLSLEQIKKRPETIETLFLSVKEDKREQLQENYIKLLQYGLAHKEAGTLPPGLGSIRAYNNSLAARCDRGPIVLTPRPGTKTRSVTRSISASKPQKQENNVDSFLLQFKEKE